LYLNIIINCLIYRDKLS